MPRKPDHGRPPARRKARNSKEALESAGGPYLSEAAVGERSREDYSPGGTAWEFFHTIHGALPRVSLGGRRHRRASATVTK